MFIRTPQHRENISRWSAKANCDPSRASSSTIDSVATGPMPLFALHGALPLSSRTRLLFAPDGNNSARPETSTPPATSTPCSDACLRASSRRCGAARFARNASTLIELGPGRGLFAPDVLDWAAEEVSRLRRALRYRLWSNRRTSASAPAERLRQQSQRSASTFPNLGSRREPRGSEPHPLRATNSLTPYPSKSSIIAARCESPEIAGKFGEHFVPASAAELDFIDRYGVHPEPGERVEVSPRRRSMDGPHRRRLR